ncbi:MAG TPA: PTS system mannose/fructose/sorbose family transporter subunit IID [Candidatus Eisenbacteria bacterium]|nr:PTS system mannose/fructose/sorbose family transporter subunit IID [Candidatus Eisenbacteria bacterium]
MSEPLRASDLARTTTSSLHLQALLTPERMQGPGFAFAMLPALRRLYPDREALASAMTRHLAYFATHPVLAGFALGAAVRLEERRAAGEPIPDEEIDARKRSLASPLAALGDPLFWLTLRPLAGLVGVLAILLFEPPVANEVDLRVLACPLLTLLTYNAVALPFRIAGVARGYADADRPGALVRSLRLSEWRVALERAGAVAFGALIALTMTLLDIGSGGWGDHSGARAAALAPLVLGGVVGLVGLSRWPGRCVETALAALAAAAVLAAIL